MDSLIVGLLIAVLVSNIFIVIGLAVCAYLAYKTLVRPEAPCYAGMMPKLGMMTVDPSHPAYSALAKKLKAAPAEEPVDKGGNYL